MLSKSNRCEVGAISLTLAFHIQRFCTKKLCLKRNVGFKIRFILDTEGKKPSKDVKCFLPSLDVTIRFLWIRGFLEECRYCCRSEEKPNMYLHYSQGSFWFQSKQARTNINGWYITNGEIKRWQSFLLLSLALCSLPQALWHVNAIQQLEVSDLPFLQACCAL